MKLPDFLYAGYKLRKAARFSCDIRSVRERIEKRDDPNSLDSFGAGALDEAARLFYDKDNIAVIKYLLDQGARFHKEVLVPFMEKIALTGDDLLLERLCVDHGLGIDGHDCGNGVVSVPIIAVARNGKASTLRLLFKLGASPSKAIEEEAFLYSVERGSADHIKVFLDRGIDVGCSVQQKNPLAVAVEMGNTPIINLLIENGAKLNDPAVLSASLGDITRMEEFHCRGADYRVLDDSLPDAILRNTRNRGVILLGLWLKEDCRLPEILRFLLDRALQTDFKDANGFSALHYLCQIHCVHEGDADCVVACLNILHEYGADMRLIAGKKPYPNALELAMYHSFDERVHNWLLEHGVTSSDPMRYAKIAAELEWIVP